MELLVRFARGELTAPDRLTVAQLIQRFFKTKALSVKPKTRAGYEAYARLHILPHLGSVRVQALKPTQVRDLYALLLGPLDKGESLVHQVRAVLCQALGEAVMDGIVTRNVARGVKIPRGKKRQQCPDRAVFVPPPKGAPDVEGSRPGLLWNLL